MKTGLIINLQGHCFSPLLVLNDEGGDIERHKREVRFGGGVPKGKPCCRLSLRNERLQILPSQLHTQHPQ